MKVNIKWADDKDKREVTLTLGWTEAWNLTQCLEGSEMEVDADRLADALEDAATEPWTFESYSELVRSGHLVVTDPQSGMKVVSLNDAALRLAFDQFMGNVKTDQRYEAQLTKRFHGLLDARQSLYEPDLTFDDQERGF